MIEHIRMREHHQIASVQDTTGFRKNKLAANGGTGIGTPTVHDHRAAGQTVKPGSLGCFALDFAERVGGVGGRIRATARNSLKKMKA
jgi:hypothetical protein